MSSPLLESNLSPRGCLVNANGCFSPALAYLSLSELISWLLAQGLSSAILYPFIFVLLLQFNREPISAQHPQKNPQIISICSYRNLHLYTHKKESILIVKSNMKIKEDQTVFMNKVYECKLAKPNESYVEGMHRVQFAQFFKNDVNKYCEWLKKQFNTASIAGISEIRNAEKSILEQSSHFQLGSILDYENNESFKAQKKQHSFVSSLIHTQNKSEIPKRQTTSELRNPQPFQVKETAKKPKENILVPLELVKQTHADKKQFKKIGNSGVSNQIASKIPDAKMDKKEDKKQPAGNEGEAKEAISYISEEYQKMKLHQPKTQKISPPNQPENILKANQNIPVSSKQQPKDSKVEDEEEEVEEVIEQNGPSYYDQLGKASAEPLDFIKNPVSSVDPVSSQKQKQQKKQSQQIVAPVQLVPTAQLKKDEKMETSYSEIQSSLMQPTIVANKEIDQAIEEKEEKIQKEKENQREEKKENQREEKKEEQIAEQKKEKIEEQPIKQEKITENVAVTNNQQENKKNPINSIPDQKEIDKQKIQEEPAIQEGIKQQQSSIYYNLLQSKKYQLEQKQTKVQFKLSQNKEQPPINPREEEQDLTFQTAKEANDTNQFHSIDIQYQQQSKLSEQAPQQNNDEQTVQEAQRNRIQSHKLMKQAVEGAIQNFISFLEKEPLCNDCTQTTKAKNSLRQKSNEQEDKIQELLDYTDRLKKQNFDLEIKLKQMQQKVKDLQEKEHIFRDNKVHQNGMIRQRSEEIIKPKEIKVVVNNNIVVEQQKQPFYDPDYESEKNSSDREQEINGQDPYFQNQEEEEEEASQDEGSLQAENSY